MSVDVQALAEAIETALAAERIFDVDSYGWLNEDDIDPDFVGYAMWGMNPPFEFDFPTPENARVASKSEQRLVELGTDFEGLMKAARYAIGSVLIHRNDVHEWDYRPTPFEFHEISALVTLSMASDRVRGCPKWQGSQVGDGYCTCATRTD
jgi:hypothetical protein